MQQCASECVSLFRNYLKQYLCSMPGTLCSSLMYVPGPHGQQAALLAGNMRQGGWLPNARRTCCSMADTLRSCERTLRSSMTAYSSSTRRPEFGRSGRPPDSFSRSVLCSNPV